MDYDAMTDSATEDRAAETRQYPTVRKVPPAPRDGGPTSSRGLGAEVIAWLNALHARAHAMVLVAALGGILALILSGAFSGLFPGSHHKSLGPPPGIVVVGSSWVTGEPSLAASPQFASIENRAAALGSLRWAAYEQLIAEIAAAKRAAAARMRAELRRKYEELRARELAAYHAELVKIQRERAQQLAKERAAKLAYERALAKYMRERTVTPGKECQDPTVRKYFSCQNGLLPAGNSGGH